MPFFSFASITFGNFDFKCKNASEFLSIYFTNCFINPSLICSGGKYTLAGFTKGTFDTFFLQNEEIQV